MEKKQQRERRRENVRQEQPKKEESNRKRAIGGGQPNELGITQGQNGEQGNTTDPRNAVKPTRKDENLSH